MLTTIIIFITPQAMRAFLLLNDLEELAGWGNLIETLQELIAFNFDKIEKTMDFSLSFSPPLYL